MDAKQLAQGLSWVAQAEKLCLENVEGELRDQDFCRRSREIFERAQALKELSATACSLAFLHAIDACPGLVRLELTECDAREVLQVPYFKFPCLRTLRLPLNYIGEDGADFSGLRGLAFLEELDLRNNRLAGRGAVATLPLVHLPRLRRLHLGINGVFAEEVAALPFRQLVQLRYLNLEESEWVHPEERVTFPELAHVHRVVW